MPGKRFQEDTHQTSIRIPKALYDEIEELAEASERTVADQIRFMLKKCLEFERKR